MKVFRRALRLTAMVICALTVSQLLVAPAARADDPIEIHLSTLGTWGAYVQPLVENGVETGIRVYYQVSGLRDAPGSSANYSAVCVGFNHYACYDSAAKAWANNGGGTIGAWYFWGIRIPCSDGATRWVEMMQPYLTRSGLNWVPIGEPPVRNQYNYFNYGSADSAYIQIAGCHQILTGSA